jgi:hypothetical protein
VTAVDDLAKRRPKVASALARAAAIEGAHIREVQFHRKMVVLLTVVTGGFTMLAGTLLLIGGPARLRSAFYVGAERIVPGWPVTWAVGIFLAGLILVTGWAVQSWTVGVVGATLCTFWSYAYMALAWVSISNPVSGAKVSLIPFATYGFNGSVALLLTFWLAGLARLSRADAG